MSVCGFPSFSSFSFKPSSRLVFDLLSNNVVREPFCVPINNGFIDDALKFYESLCVRDFGSCDEEFLKTSSNVYANCYIDLLKVLRVGVKGKWNNDVWFIDGVPGSGKSSFVRKLPINCTNVVVPFSSLKDSYRSCGFSCLTVHSAVSRVKRCKFLVFDEYTNMCEWLVFTIILSCQPEVVLFVGDFRQCWLQPNEGKNLKSFVESFGFNVCLRKCHRLPCQDVVELCSCFCPNIMPKHVGVDCFCEKFSFYNVAEGFSMEFGESLCIGFSNKTVDYMAEFGVPLKTVRSCMGLEHDNVNLFIFRDFDIRLLRVKELRYVGLTRHKLKLNILSDMCKEDCLALLIDRFSNESQFLVNEEVDLPEREFEYAGSLESYIDSVLEILNL